MEKENLQVISGNVGWWGKGWFLCRRVWVGLPQGQEQINQGDINSSPGKWVNLPYEAEMSWKDLPL